MSSVIPTFIKSDFKLIVFEKSLLYNRKLVVCIIQIGLWNWAVNAGLIYSVTAAVQIGGFLF